MQNQHPIDPSPWVWALWKGMVWDAAPSTSALLHGALLNGQSLPDSCAFLFPSHVVLGFDECVSAHVGGCSLFLEADLSRSNSVSTVSNGEIIAR